MKLGLDLDGFWILDLDLEFRQGWIIVEDTRGFDGYLEMRNEI